jgi:putative aminophosphonate oxidoreductase
MTRLQPVHIAATRSLWLKEAIAQEQPAPPQPLQGAHRTDVCIVGGGYTGLWTALFIKERQPDLDVMVLEADICGGGASGRNGGLALGWWAKLSTLIKLCGEDEGVRLARAAGQAVFDIGDFCQEHDIDAHYVQAGLLRTATTPLHLATWEDQVRACEARGLDVYQRLTPEEVQSRGGSPVYVGGILERGGATLQPALLARGMRRVALERGIAIYEQSPVIDLDQGRPPAVRTPRGVVSAEKVVLATNAWMASLHALRRAMIVVSSDMVVTAPIPDRLKEMGWTGGEGISDSRLMVHYHQATRDGRIAIGRGSGALAYLGRVTPTFNGNYERSEAVVHGLHTIYPMLQDVPITDRWAGPIDRTRSGTLMCGRLNGKPDVIYGAGYSGTGVAPSLVGAKILTSAALELDDEWSNSRLNQGWVLQYPPDPVRFFGGLFVRSNVYRKEEGEQRGGEAGLLRSFIAQQAYPRLPRKVAKGD